MRIVTHSGNFHTDDIFAVATLLILFPDAEVVRSREAVVWKTADILVDVGGVYNPDTNHFDHHQREGAGVRKNSIPYASFGLVWKEFGEQVSGSAEARDIIDEKLAMPIDAIDNGVSLSSPKFPGVREYTLYDYLSAYIDPEETGPDRLLQTFMSLVVIARDLLVREVAIAKKIVEDTNNVREIINRTEDKNIVVIPGRMHWERAVAEVPEVIYVVYPRREGSWGVRAVSKGNDGFDRKKSLPEAWVGKEAGDLASITGVPDVMFIHKGRHLASTKSKEGAIKLAEIALKS